MAELLVDRGFETDYVTRRLWKRESPVATFNVVGVWSGEIYDDRGVRRTSSALRFATSCFGYFLRRRNRYEIVIASALPMLTAIAVRLALMGTKTRVIADWLEIWGATKWRSYAGVFGGTLAAGLQWAAIRLLREHTVNSFFTAERLRRARRISSVTVLGLVDLARDGVVEAAASPPEVLFVGRLIADKRAHLVPAVVDRARATLPGLTATIVGDGPLRQLIESTVESTAMSHVVKVPGHVGDGELAALRARASVLLAPSIREGFGLVVAESAAAGVPVVVVDHADNAAADLVEPGVNGEIAIADDVESLAAAVVRVVEAGQTMRDSTLRWFVDARQSRGLAASVDAIIAGRSEPA
jgi:glycosyltransferase involved in cell wall biosynthesis